MRSLKFRALVPVLSFVALTGGCNADDGDGEGSLYEEACEHMGEGPAEPVTAVIGTDAPDVSTSHTRYDVGLVSVDGGNGGDVSFASAEASDYTFFLSHDVALTVRDAVGADVAVESREVGQAPCDAVAAAVTVELGVGTYTLSLGPTAESRVSLVVEAAGEAHADE